MTGAEYRGRRGHTDLSPAPSAAGFFSRATVVAVLALITILASLLPGVTTAQAQKRLELATVNNGAVYHKWSDHPDDPNSWSSWTYLSAPGGYALVGTPYGYYLTGTPAVVSDGIGRLNVFALSMANPQSPGVYYNGLWQRSSTDANYSWSDWTPVPGQDGQGQLIVPGWGSFQMVTSPAAASWGPGRMDLFVLGYNSSYGLWLLHTWADNYSWHGSWEGRAPGTIDVGVSSIAVIDVGVASWGPGRLDVFMRSLRSGYNILLHVVFDNGEWRWGADSCTAPCLNCADLGGPPNGGLASSPAAAGWSGHRINIFTRGTNGWLWGTGVSDGNWLGGWGTLPTALADVVTPVATTSPTDSTLDVFGIDTARILYRTVWDDYTGAWTGWQYVDGAPPTNEILSNIAATAWNPYAPPQPQPPPPPPPECVGGDQICLPP